MLNLIFGVSNAMMRFVNLTMLILLILSPALARGEAEANSHSIVATHGVRDSVKSTDSPMRINDTSCSCHASFPIELVASSLIWGIPAYWGYRGPFDDNVEKDIVTWPAIVAVSLFLPLLSLAPAANWTSDCEANWWHAMWIGFGSNLACTILYGVAYGNHHVLNYYKFNWPEYAALGVAPTVIASLVYNQFLHPRPKDRDDHSSDQGMYLLPSVNWNKSVTMNFGIRF